MKALARLTVLTLLFATSAIWVISSETSPNQAAGATTITTTALTSPTTPTTTTTATTSSTAAPPTTTPTPTPTTSPATTSTTPSTPTTSPATTTTAPLTPTTSPAATTTALSTPTTSPAATTTTLSTPTTSPAATTTALSTPTTSPAATTTTLSTPTTRPATASTAPSTPTTRPATASTAPSTPTTRPATATTAAPTTTPLPTKDLCQKDSCLGDSACVNLNNTYFCLCTVEYYYESPTCKKGKIFPGTLKVKVSETSDLGNKRSEAYEKLHKDVLKFFADAFTNSDYRQTVINQISNVPAARSETRADDKVVEVAVVNLFAENTQQNLKTISEKISAALLKNPGNVAGYDHQDRCDFYGCVKTDQDDCGNGLQCQCKEGLERPNPQTPLCLVCDDGCTAEHNKQCLVKSGGAADCVCRPGYQKDGQGACHACPFGYTGVNCEDQFQLILTVVGTLAGILILGMLVALIYIRSKKEKDIEEEHLIENDFQNLKLQHMTGFSNTGAEGNIFPKIRSTIPRDTHLQNPYGKQSGIPRPDY